MSAQTAPSACSEPEATIDRPLVRYHGGKWRIADWIISLMPAHRIYVEPFGGGASVLLRKQRVGPEVYNDLDFEIVNLFRVLRNRGQELRRLLELTPFSRHEFDVSYIPIDDPIEQARRTLVRAWMAHGGDGCSGQYRSGFRGLRERRIASPATEWAGFPDFLPAMIDRLRGVTIERDDAMSVLDRYDGQDTLFYVDPPYPHDVRSRVRGYRHELSDAQHRALVDRVLELRGCVMVSGYAHPLYDTRFATWDRFERPTTADRGVSRTEVVWVKP